MIAHRSLGIGKCTVQVAATRYCEQPSRFALTPALSPGERVERSLPHFGVHARIDRETRGDSSPKFTSTPKRSDAVDAHPSHHATAEVPPLPGGEGWGEGDPGSMFRNPISFDIHSPVSANWNRGVCSLLIAHRSLGIGQCTVQVAATRYCEQPPRSTPALSPGERVKRSLPDRSDDARLELETRRLSSLVFTYTPKRSDAVDARPYHRDATEVPPLLGGEGWGEGGSQRQSPLTLRSVFSLLHLHQRPGIIRQRMQRACLQGIKDRVPNRPRILAKVRVPKPQHFDPTLFQLRIPGCIPLATLR